MADGNGARAQLVEARLMRQIERQIGGQVCDFVARVGADAARKQIERELRRARLARSRRFYRAWSAVLEDIDGLALPQAPGAAQATRRRRQAAHA